MASTTRSHPEADMFSGSVNPSFLHSEFKAAGHDIFSPTFNVNFTAPLPPPRETAPRRHPPATSSGPSSSPALKGVKRILSRLSPRRRPSSNPEGPTGLPTASRQSSYDSDDTPPLTSGSSCTPSPFSSQEDITVSSVEDLDSKFLESQNLTTPQIYVQSMLKSGKGLACWKPRPRKSSPGERGIVPGDVGSFSAEGGFKRTFNVWDDEDGLRRTACVNGGALFELPPRHVAIDPEDIPRGSTIAEGASSHTVFSESNPDTISSFEFRCHSPHGAVLAVTSSAELEELEDHTVLRDFVIRHSKLIYKHANSIRRIDTNEPLYIITGCIKSDSWALAAFRGALPPPHDAMSLLNMTHDGDARSRYAWTRRSTSEAHFGMSDVQGLKDQTLFLRGFKLDFSQAFRGRMRQLPRFPNNRSSGKDDFDPSDSSRPSGGHEAPGGSRGQEDGGWSGPGGSSSPAFGDSTQGRSSGNGGHQDREHSPYRSATQLATQEVSVRTFPGSVEATCHPSDAINQYLLHTTGADFALCHDDEWRFALEDSDDPSEFVGASFAGLEIEVRNGVAMLPQGPRGRDIEHDFNHPAPWASGAFPVHGPSSLSCSVTAGEGSGPSSTTTPSACGNGADELKRGKRSFGRPLIDAVLGSRTRQTPMAATQVTRDVCPSSFCETPDALTPRDHRAPRDRAGGPRDSASTVPMASLHRRASNNLCRLAPLPSADQKSDGTSRAPCSGQPLLSRGNTTQQPPSTLRKPASQAHAIDIVEVNDTEANLGPRVANEHKENPMEACSRCKSLKLICEARDKSGPYQQCLDGGHECMPGGRKARRFIKRERPFDRIRSQAKKVESLLPAHEVGGKSNASYRQPTAKPHPPAAGLAIDANATDQVLWPTRAQMQVSVANTQIYGSDSHYYAHQHNGDFAVRSPVLGNQVPDSADTKGLSFDDPKARSSVRNSFDAPCLTWEEAASMSLPTSHSSGISKPLFPQTRLRATERSALCMERTKWGTVRKSGPAGRSELNMKTTSLHGLDILFLNKSMPDLGSDLCETTSLGLKPSLNTSRILGDGRAEPPRMTRSPETFPLETGPPSSSSPSNVSAQAESLQDNVKSEADKAAPRKNHDAARTKCYCLGCTIRWQKDHGPINGERCGECQCTRFEHLRFGLERPDRLGQTRNAADACRQPKNKAPPASQLHSEGEIAGRDPSPPPAITSPSSLIVSSLAISDERHC